jgi:hypothetical protein
MKTNLSDYALRALEKAKEDLRRDKYLLPVAFIVTEDDVFDFNLQFEDAEQKRTVYDELVKLAKERTARAIITINDATLTNHSEGSSSDTAMTRADIKLPQHCIFVTVSGPSIRTCSISLPYVSTGSQVVFGNPTETVNDVLNLLPGWPMVRKPDA